MARQTPWGTAQHTDRIAAGIKQVSCAGHGGVHLDAVRNAKVPGPLRNADGWYEEDVEAYIANWVFADEFAAWRRANNETVTEWCDPEKTREYSADQLRDWMPDEWSAATGETVDVAQSRVLAEREFSAKHADDWVAISAIGATADNGLADDEVAVTCTIGGLRDGRDEVTFVVAADEYRQRGSRRFVVDEARHRRV